MFIALEEMLKYKLNQNFCNLPTLFISLSEFLICVCNGKYPKFTNSGPKNGHVCHSRIAVFPHNQFTYNCFGHFFPHFYDFPSFAKALPIQRCILCAFCRFNIDELPIMGFS